MAIDWDRFVIHPTTGVFGEAVNYRPTGKPAFDLSGVFDDAYHSINLIEGTPVMNTSTPIVGVRLADFPQGLEPRKGDMLLIKRVNTIYKVKDVNPDGHGHAKLMLNEQGAGP